MHNSKCRTGWFTEPTPFFTGGLSAEEAEEALDEAMEEVMSVLADMPAATGGCPGKGVTVIAPVTGPTPCPLSLPPQAF